MSDLFASAASCLLGNQPQGEAGRAALKALEALDYLQADGYPSPSPSQDAETRHRAHLLMMAARSGRIFELSAPDARGLVCLGAEFDPALADPLHHGSPPIGVSGVGLTLREAFERCVGEGTEYLSQLQTSDDELSRAASEGRMAALAPGTRQFVASLVASRTGPHTELSWHPARRLTDGREIWLPADLCLRRPPAQQDFTPPFPLSIGSAAGSSWERAALHGLLELIERDAASLWWRGGRRGRAIPPEHDAYTKTLLHQLRAGASAPRRTWLLDITTDIGLPSIVAVSCRLDGFGFAFGLAARPTLAAAIRSATLELCQLELAYAVVEAKRSERGQAGLNAKDHIHLQRASAINADRCMLLQPIAEYAQHVTIDTTNPQVSLEWIADHLEARGIQTLCLDLTRPRFAIPVARIIAPPLQLEPSEIITPRLAETIAQTGGGNAYAGGIPLL